MNKIKHALIMAAGRGSRMIPLTDSIPKAMARYGNTTLIVNGIEKLRPIIPHIHITVGYKKAALAKHVIEHHVNTVINTEGKGNAWWLYNSLLKYLNEPVAVLTCDNVVDLNFDKLASDYYSLKEPACMVVPVKPVPGLEGDYIFEKEQVVEELNRSKPSDKYCSGIQIVNPYKINKTTQPTEDFYTVWKQLMVKKELKCSTVYPSMWYTVDTMEQLRDLNTSLK
jgi:NDP-sugar pyrophosphorylase family protein